MTADAENQTDIARSSATASRVIGLRFEEGIFRIAYISEAQRNVNYGVGSTTYSVVTAGGRALGSLIVPLWKRGARGIGKGVQR
jgi:hypothetical protein